MLTKKQINKAISHLDLEVIGNGDGYFYFVCTKTDSQYGENVPLPRLNMQTLEDWVRDAEVARVSKIIDGMDTDNHLEDLERYAANWRTA